MKVENGIRVLIDWDTADAVMEEQLLYLNHSMSRDIKILKSKKKLKDWELEDLEHFERVQAAIEIVAQWCVYDFHKKVKKYAKRQL